MSATCKRFGCENPHSSESEYCAAHKSDIPPFLRRSAPNHAAAQSLEDILADKFSQEYVHMSGRLGIESARASLRNAIDIEAMIRPVTACTPISRHANCEVCSLTQSAYGRDGTEDEHNSAYKRALDARDYELNMANAILTVVRIEESLGGASRLLESVT